MGCTLRGERSADRKRTATVDEITYERVFVVQSDDDDIGAREVSFCAGIPLNGVTYATETEEDPLCKVIQREATPVGEHRQLWEVRITYSSKQQENESEDDDPEREPPEVSITHATRMKAILERRQVRTYAGGGGVNPIVPGAVLASNGEPFDPPAEDEQHYPILTVTRNERNLNMDKVRAYVGAVNSDIYMGAQPACCKVSALDAHKVFKKGYRYWRVTYVIEFNEENWDLKLLDHGTYYFDNNGEMKLFVTDDEPPQPRLGLLDGTGKALANGAQPVFLAFPRNREVPFAVLNLEASIFG